MTAPIAGEPAEPPADADANTDAEPVDRPGAPGASVVAVLAAFLVGLGAVGVSSVLSSAGLRVLVAVVVLVAGWAVARSANDPDTPLSLALGHRVLRGIGTSFGVLGAYLLGLALFTATASVEPSPAVVILLVYGVPAVALLVVARTGMRAWAAGAGAILPMLAVLLLVAAEVGAAPVSITMLVAGALLTVLAVRAPSASRWGDLASASAAMSASFAFGAGTSPFGSLGTTQLGGAAGAGGGLTGGAQAAVAGGALLVAVVVLVVAVLRWDLASGVLAGSVFAMPPVLLRTELPFGDWPAGTRVVLVAVPVLTAIVALVAIRSHRFRRAIVSVPAALRDHRPGDAVSAAACAVVVAGAALAFVALAMPVFGWDPTVQGAIALVVLVAAAALAYWLPDDTPGATAAVLALLGLTFASPWVRLLVGGLNDVTTTGLVITGVVDLAVAGALAFLLVRRHRRVGVYAAAAYTLAASFAACLGSLLFNPAATSGPFTREWAPVLIVALPLLVLAIPAAAVAFGPRAAVGQAVGAVVLAAGGFLPMKVMVAEFAAGADAGYAMQISLGPLTPTDWLMTSSALRTVTGPALVAVVVLVLVAFVLAASLARRPSAPLAAAVTLLLLSALQASLLTALSEWSAEEAELLGWVLGIGAVVAAVLAVGVGSAAARRRPA